MRGEAERELNLTQKEFYDTVCALRNKGFYITIHRNRFDPQSTIYELKSEDDRAADEKRPHYSLSKNKRLWGIWRNMRERCNRQGHKSYADYGGRGIRVCEEWEEAFQTFAEWAYETGYDDDAPYMKCTLDRIDPNGNYEPSNCRWISMKEQCNNRRNNHLLTCNGVTKTVAEWSDSTRIPRDTIVRRLKMGWSVEKALNTPVKKQKNNRANIWSAPLVRTNA